MTKNTQIKQFSNKQELRAWAKKNRSRKDFDNLNQEIVKKIKSLNVYNSSHSVMLFYPLKDEINLLDLLSDKKQFSFPCMKDNKIVPFLAGKDYKTGAFQVQEPTGTEPQNPNELDLVIVPALCADKNGYRVGYGKGCYDKFIKTLNRSKTKLLTPIFDDLIVDNIDFDEFDEKVDFIVSEKRVIQL